MAKPSAANLARAASICAGGNAIDSAIDEAVTGPSPSRRLRTISTSASSFVQLRAANSSGASIAGVSGTRPNTAWNCGIRSAAIASVLDPDRVPAAAITVNRVARRASQSSATSELHFAFASISCAVTKPRPSNVSCNSSAVFAPGQASALTRSIASTSSRPNPAAASSSSQRRLITARVRRSSSGASSR